MKIKATWKDGIEIDTDGTPCWSSTIVAVGVAGALIIFAWKYVW